MIEYFERRELLSFREEERDNCYEDHFILTEKENRSSFRALM